MKEKKENIFKKIKRWWKEELTDDERTWLKVVGVWTVDGALIGSIITGTVKNKQIRKAAEVSYSKGYLTGTLDTYREITQQNPYQQIDNGFKKFEKQGKVNKF